MANNTLILSGKNYLRFPINEDFYPTDTICIDFDLTLRSWNQPHSSQIVGNFNNQGYGIFYQNGLEEISNLTITDCGNNHIFFFNQEGKLVSQRDFPEQENSIEIVTQTIDQFGNKYYYDQGNNKVFRFDTNNILVAEFSLIGESFQINTINVDSVGDVYFLNVAEDHILQYTNEGSYVSTHALVQSGHTNFTITRQDEIKSFYSNAGTPMLTDCGDDYYNLFGNTLYKNGNGFFFASAQANTFGIDVDDFIWIVYQGNKIIKLDKRGRVVFNKEFHNIKPCIADPCDTTKKGVSISFTRQLTIDGYEEYTWVVLEESNYALKLNGNADIVDCILLTNSLDVERYPEASFENVRLCTNGDFTSYRHKKNYSVNCVNNNDSRIVAKVAIVDACDGNTKYRTLSHNVTSLSGTHNFKFLYNGLDGQGKLFLNGNVVDSFEHSGAIFYNEGSNIPTLIGADSGNNRAKKEELGIDDPVFFKGTINNLALSKSFDTFSRKQRRLAPIKMELPTKYPVSFKEDVDLFYLFRPNGFKSSKFNLNIINSGFEDSEDQLKISEEVFDLVEQNVPVINTVNKLNWKSDLKIKDLREYSS